MTHLTYAEAMLVGLVQGVTELFPVSSLGHNVLIPALIGGSWAQDLNVSRPESPYLAFIVGLHVATAIAMIIYFRRDWIRIVGGFLSSVRDRRIATADQRLAWMIVLATIPVGIAGLALEHLFRVVFSKPVPTALFLAANGLILLAGERKRRRSALDAPPAATPAMTAQGASTPASSDAAPATGPGNGTATAATRPANSDPAREADHAVAADRRLSVMGLGNAVLIGCAQILALLPGISRDGPRPPGAGRRPLLVPALGPGDPSRRRPEDTRLYRPARQRHSRPGTGRQLVVGRRRPPVGQLPGPLLRQVALTGSVRHLLPRGRPGQRGLPAPQMSGAAPVASTIPSFQAPAAVY